MGNKLYVGNLPYSTTDDSLKELFAPHGNVVSANVITDKQTGRSKGFGFVEMESDGEAQSAIGSMDGHEVDGRKIRVSEARPKKDFSSGGGFKKNRY